MDRRRRAHEELPSDDEVEKFHKTKDKLSLDPAEDEASSDDGEEELDDEAVYNLSASEDSSEEDEEDDEDDDEDDEDNKSRYSQRRADSWLCRCPSLVMVPADASIHLVHR